MHLRDKSSKHSISIFYMELFTPEHTHKRFLHHGLVSTPASNLKLAFHSDGVGFNCGNAMNPENARVVEWRAKQKRVYPYIAVQSKPRGFSLIA